MFFPFSVPSTNGVQQYKVENVFNTLSIFSHQILKDTIYKAVVITVLLSYF